MEDKQTRLMMALAVVLVALVAVLKFAGDPKGEDEDTKPKAEDVVTLDGTQVAGITLQTEEGTLTADQADGAWTITAAYSPLCSISKGSPASSFRFDTRSVSALAIEDDRVVRILHVSTGAPATPTPPGDFRVYAKIERWWSVPFREWLLWSLPFNGGIAFHELADVPPYAASHGCVRERYVNSKWMFDFARVNMPVKVIARSR